MESRSDIVAAEAAAEPRAPCIVVAHSRAGWVSGWEPRGWLHMEVLQIDQELHIRLGQY